MNEETTPSNQPSRRTKVLAIVAILVGVGGMIASGVYMTRNQATAGSPAGATAEASANLPAAFLTACVAVVHPAGPVALPMRIQDLIPRLTTGAKAPTWERARDGSFILRQIAPDGLKQTEQRMAMQFDPVKIGSTDCFALSRVLVDDEEQPQADIWAVAQQFAAQIEMERLNKQASATLAADSSAAAAESQPDAAAADAGTGQGLDQVDRAEGNAQRPGDANQQPLGRDFPQGIVRGTPYRDARALLFRKGFKAMHADVPAPNFSAYPEIDCAGDAGICTAEFTSPAGRRVNVICRFSEGPDDGAPMRTIAIDGVVAGD